MKYLSFNKLFLKNLVYYPYPRCPYCNDKLVFYKENNRYGLFCRSECHEYSDTFPTIPVMIREWNQHCLWQLEQWMAEQIVKLDIISMIIMFIMFCINGSPIYVLLTFASLILIPFHEFFAKQYMNYQIKKYKKYIELLDQNIRDNSKGGFAPLLHIPLETELENIEELNINDLCINDLDIKKLNRLKKQLSKVNGDTAELITLYNKLETLINLRNDKFIK